MSKFAKKGHLVVDTKAAKLATVGGTDSKGSNKKVLEKAGIKEAPAKAEKEAKTSKGLKLATKEINKKLAKVAAKEKSEDTRKIKLLVKENPKREGSDSFKRFELYKSATTVADFIKAGGTAADVRYDEKAEYIKVS